jgi:chitin disaccharide deacetylase
MRFVLNADDFALSAAVDEGILELARRGIVTSTSALVCAPRWATAARLLDGVAIDVGLHLDLTTAPASTGKSLPDWLVLSWLRLVDRKQIRNTIRMQCERFEAILGRAPVFVDGHEHVHQLPIVRDILLDELSRRYGNARPYFRVCHTARHRGFKAELIDRLGSRPLARKLTAQGFPHNSDFAGVYDFRAEADLPALWHGWLGNLTGPLPLIMCHVATGQSGQESSDDAIFQARLREYEWLSSDAFQALCKSLDTVPVRWPET